jgi:predicted transcriptional regulator
MKMSRVSATRVAFIVAQFCAAGFFIWGLYFGNYILCFIAVFVVLTSRMEWKGVQRAAAIKGQTISALMSPIHTKLYQDQSIREAIEALRENEKYFLVFNRNDTVVGVLFHEFILHAQAKQDLDSPIGKYQSNSWNAFRSDYPLENAIAIFQQRGYGIVPIMENNILVGQLDIDTLNRFVKSI